MDKEIKIFSLSGDKVAVDTSLALRFLRVRKEVDEQTKDVFRSCLDEFIKAVSYKSSYRYFDIVINENKVSFGDEMVLESEKLAKNLTGCKGAFVFVATTTVALDRLIEKHLNLRVSRALIIDAIGSSAIECFCDILSQKICEEYKVLLRPRFSPGYGDLSVVSQDKVLNCCDACRKIGVTLTENHLMIPKKSVSAIVGVRPKNEVCDKSSSCENCEADDCPYRE